MQKTGNDQCIATQGVREAAGSQMIVKTVMCNMAKLYTETLLREICKSLCNIFLEGL